MPLLLKNKTASPSVLRTFTDFYIALCHILRIPSIPPPPSESTRRHITKLNEYIARSTKYLSKIERNAYEYALACAMILLFRRERTYARPLGPSILLPVFKRRFVL